MVIGYFCAKFRHFGKNLGRNDFSKGAREFKKCDDTQREGYQIYDGGVADRWVK